MLFRPKQSPVYGNFWSKEDCHAATPSLAGGAREEQEQRLAMTYIYEMYGSESFFANLENDRVSFRKRGIAPFRKRGTASFRKRGIASFRKRGIASFRKRGMEKRIMKKGISLS